MPHGFDAEHSHIQREKLLYLVERMRQIQEAATDNQRVPQLPFGSSSPTPPNHQMLSQTPKRPLYSQQSSPDQPLDFSATKKHRPSSHLWGPISQESPSNKHDSLGSDGNSDMSGSHSPDFDSSPRLPRPGSSSPPRPALPRIKIPIPSPDDSICDQKPDLLAISSSNNSTYFSTQSAPKLPLGLLHPRSSIQTPRAPPSTPEQFSSLSNFQNSLPYHPKHSIFPSSNKPVQFSSSPIHLTSSPIPPPPQPPLSELSMIASNSQLQYANFRETMLRNIEQSRNKVPRKTTTPQLKSEHESEEDQQSSFLMSTSDNQLLNRTPLSTKDEDSKMEQRSGEKDETYWERRRKNNEAAKRSRDSRRQKENEIAVRASYLEQENIQLKMELVQLRTELGSIRDQITIRPLTAN